MTATSGARGIEMALMLVATMRQVLGRLNPAELPAHGWYDLRGYTERLEATLVLTRRSLAEPELSGYVRCATYSDAHNEGHHQCLRDLGMVPKGER
jgi:hypothetical protein